MPTEVKQENWINLDESTIHMDDGTTIKSAESITTDNLKDWGFNIVW